MQIYNNATVDELDEASRVLREALEAENRVIKFAASLFVYEFVAFMGMIVLSSLLDHQFLRFGVPFAMVAIVTGIEVLLNVMKWRAWKNRYEKETEYFVKSRALTDYNTERVVQLLAVQELAANLNSPSDEPRVIN